MLKRIRAILGGFRGKAATDEAGRPPVHRGPKVVHWPIAESDLDPDAVKIVRRLTRFDHKAYLVGGCVRDLLLERKPKDFDVGTSATPRQIKRLFRNCRIIGRRFRLAHIYFQKNKIIEVATFRSQDGQDAEANGEDQDLLIRDDNVFGTPEEDALRRDFTINALFYDVGESTVLDHADGLGDLRRKLIRTIGDPEVRFREDPIRILRAIKFAARLDFRIESKTLAALEQTRGELDRAAPPRVLEELNRFCRSAAARRSFELMGETRVFEVVFPELAGRVEAEPRNWKRTLDLLGRMDRERAEQSREIRTGEILACVLLPLLAPAVGWQDGKAVRQRGLNLRALIDEALRPLSLRLRVPRREQEHCRQILATLFRMVPVGRTRRSTRRAIVQRECFPDALWILRELAERERGDFAAGLESWAAEARPESRERPAREEQGRKRQRSRRGRGGRGRGGRGQRSRQTREHEGRAKPDRAAKAREEKDRNLPPVWDDDYFFAALPEAPDEGADDVKTDRYGTSTAEARPRTGPAAEPAAEPSTESATEPAAESAAESATEPAEAGDAARPRRRRRRRRRNPSGGSAKPGQRGAPTPPSTEEPDS